MAKQRILVVDDEPGIALLCNRLLSREGYAVETFTDPRAAVSYLEKNPVDLLLVDIRMPEVDGFEVIAHTQRLQPEAATLIMTGHGTVETAIRALRQGVDGLILKPFDQGSELVEAIKQSLQDSQQKRDAARARGIRPLFFVTESLLSETNSERLPGLVVDAICEHLHCSHAAYYQTSPGDSSLKLLACRGIPPSQGLGGNAEELLNHATQRGLPYLLNAQGPGDALLKPLLTNLGLGGVVVAPLQRPGFVAVTYAARKKDEPAFRDTDLELLQILGRQAAVAMENALLYTEQAEHLRKMEQSQKALIQAEKMATAGRLSASIAHEVNNPLQAVQNCLHLAARDDVPPEKRREYFDLARTELERLMVTVRRMLDFYRPHPGSYEEQNVAQVLEYVLALMAKQLSERGVQVDLDLAADLPSVAALESQIQQVFINLVLNAADAMPRGGKLQIMGRAANGGVEISFTDSGPGVPVEQQARIFEPFFSTKDGGTGLGLTVSYNIVTAHGGTLELAGEHQGGARFRVFLPSEGKK